jgi:hypothetical protein
MGEWRKMPSGELHNLYSSPDIIRQIKSRRMRLAGHVAHMFLQLNHLVSVMFISGCWTKVRIVSF